MKKALGFTLIELIIAVAVLAIITMIAVPSYTSYILRSHRAEGTAALNAIQLQQEKYRTYHNTYGTLGDVWGGVTTTENGYYNLAITGNSATGYTSTATAQGNQANDMQSGVSCTTLTLTVNGLNTSYEPTTCWSR